MGIIVIESRTYNEMQRAFTDFANEIKEICYTSNLSEDWLDNQGVCRILNISKRTLQYYRDYGKVPFSQIGNKCYYKTSDIEKLISNSQIK